MLIFRREIEDFLHTAPEQVERLLAKGVDAIGRRGAVQFDPQAVQAAQQADAVLEPFDGHAQRHVPLQLPWLAGVKGGIGGAQRTRAIALDHDIAVVRDLPILRRVKELDIGWQPGFRVSGATETRVDRAEAAIRAVGELQEAGGGGVIANLADKGADDGQLVGMFRQPGEGAPEADAGQACLHHSRLRANLGRGVWFRVEGFQLGRTTRQEQQNHRAVLDEILAGSAGRLLLQEPGQRQASQAADAEEGPARHPYLVAP